MPVTQLTRTKQPKSGAPYNWWHSALMLCESASRISPITPSSISIPHITPLRHPTALADGFCRRCSPLEVPIAQQLLDQEVERLPITGTDDCRLVRLGQHHRVTVSALTLVDEDAMK